MILFFHISHKNIYGRSEVAVPFPHWPIFKVVGQWDHEGKYFIPYDDTQFTIDQLDKIVAYLKKKYQ
jgi:hypothetical protein